MQCNTWLWDDMTLNLPADIPRGEVWGVRRGLLCFTIGHRARFAVPDSGTQGTVSYSTHLPNWKGVASSISVKEFKICR